METIRVMIVEDDFMVADLNRQVVERTEGFSVVAVARNGQEALDAFARETIHLVILDVYLPDIQGLDLLKEARRRELKTDFILITAAHDARTVEESMRFGVYDYIIKPFDFARFVEALSEYRTRRSALAESGFLDQGKLDKVLEKKAAPRAPGELPKGIAPQTLEKVEAFLASAAAEVVPADLVAALRLSRITAHRYLEFLAETGRLRKELKYQKVGRPAVLYQKLR